MKLAVTLLLISFAQWAVGAPLFLLLKNIPTESISPIESLRPAKSYVLDPSKITSQRLGFLDKLSDAPVRRLGHTITSARPATTYQPPVVDDTIVDDTIPVIRKLGDEPLVVESARPPHPPSKPTLVEVDMEGLYLPYHTHENTLHYYRVRKCADLLVFGALVGFVCIILLVELWQPICKRFGLLCLLVMVLIRANIIRSVRRYRTGEGAIRLETEDEEANSESRRKECIGYCSFDLRAASEANIISNPGTEKHGGS